MISKTHCSCGKEFNGYSDIYLTEGGYPMCEECSENYSGYCSPAHESTLKAHFPGASGKIVAFNVSVLTAEGCYAMIPVTTRDAANIWEQAATKSSAIGHEATAKVISSLLGAEIPVNRVTYIQEQGETAIVLKMRQRIPEGTVLTDPKQLEEIGYDFFLLYREV